MVPVEQDCELRWPYLSRSGFAHEMKQPQETHDNLMIISDAEERLKASVYSELLVGLAQKQKPI